MKCVVHGAALVFGLTCGAASTLADPPKVHELRVQKVGSTIYFHLLLESPADLRLPGQDRRFRWWNEWEFARLPRLVPQDDSTHAVYVRMLDERETLIPPPGKKIPLTPPAPRKAPDAPKNGVIFETIHTKQPPQIGVEHLEFMGKVQDKTGRARLLLQYPTHPPGAADDDKDPTPARRLQRQASWVEVELTIDFSRAHKVDLPAGKRTRDSWPHRDDLEGAWAVTQGRHFAMLQAQTPEFGFYGVARETTSLKYTVPAPDYVPVGRGEGNDRPPTAPLSYFRNPQMYEIFTGATAITESLALHRLCHPDFRSKEEPRSVDIRNLEGVTTAEHPWAKLMAGKKPAVEPLAKLVPHDNYYVHFSKLVKFLESSELIDQWGTTLGRAVDVGSRDYLLRERLEHQLCLKSTKLARLFGPAVIKSIALTGSDPYLREGSDLTVLFHVVNQALFIASVDNHLKEARAEFPGKLKEDKQTYRDIVIESYVSPLREVSLHRAHFENYMIYSNSPAGVRRVIDVYKGQRMSLAESQDFQYMRTVFGADDPLEDGFLFFSDAFIRNLVGPALRIKERRRLEALTSLSLANNSALFAAWETGRLPASHNELLAYTGLKANQLYSPEGDAIFWSAEHKIAHSAFYNTQNFATPLIEIPIDKVTPGERAEYEQFRREYMGLWRQYFDPTGIRIKLGEWEWDVDGQPGKKISSEVRLETYILPLVQTSRYHDLRRLAGGGTIKLDPGMFHARTVAQFMTHLSPLAREREEFGNVLKILAPKIPGLTWLGNWLSVRVDDSPLYGKLAHRAILYEIERGSVRDFDEDVRLLFQIPLTMGVEIRNPIVFAGILATARTAVHDALPGAVDWEPLKERYKGTSVVQIKARANGALGAFGGRKDDPFAPTIYYALIDGAWFLSLRQECIHDEIDAALARKVHPTPAAVKVDVNSSVYASPKAAVHARAFLNQFLEWETHRRAVGNSNVLFPLYRGKIISPAEDNGATIQHAALKYLGFVPVSPDGAPYLYEAKTDEITNKRHGNLRRPNLHDTMDANAPLAELLEQIRTLRADLRFREDGLHSVVTFTHK